MSPVPFSAPPASSSPALFRSARATLLASLAAVCLVFLVVAGTHVARADPSVPGPGGDVASGTGSPCAELARRYAAQVPSGWTIECLAALPPEWSTESSGGSSMTDRRSRRIVVLDGQSPEYTEASTAHEVAHAEASSWPSLLRADVAVAWGSTRWAEGGAASPMEVFAESSVRCRGLPTDPAHPLVPCEAVEAARSAGGAGSPLPVTGTRPTS